MKRKSQREHSDKFLNAVEHNNEDDLDLILAVETLSAINQQDLHLPKYKSLRKLIFNLGFFLDGDFSKITQALELNMYDHVFYALSMMRSLDKNIKIGSVQRWVRLAALESDLGLRYRLLDAIIRTSDPDQISLTDNVEETHVQNHLRRLEPFAIPGNSEIITKVEKNWEFYLVETEKNFKDGSHLQILSHAPGSVNFENSGKIIKTDIPFIQNGFALSNVLSSNECAQLINAADSIGWIDNSGYSFTANVNKGAAGVVWLVDDSILNPIMERIKPFLPNVEKFAGINARFRFYKYSLGSEFRPHIDGSWPGSGFVNDNYAFDAYGDRWSFYTCLIYLNDASEFDGGETSFFWPSSKDGVLIKRGISPKSGAFLFFPHGNKALVHEGSAVTKGFKYVIRTDPVRVRLLTWKFLPHLDAMQARVDSRPVNAGTKRQLLIYINGVMVPIDIDLHSLRAALALPQYDLLAVGIFNVPPYEDGLNPENPFQADVDHQEAPGPHAPNEDESVRRVYSPLTSPNRI